MLLAQTGLYERAKAARHLVSSGQLDGEIALSYVIWPDITPRDILHPFQLLALKHEPDRCKAAKRTALFPTRCTFRAVDDGLCGQHLRRRREGKPLMIYEEAQEAA